MIRSFLSFLLNGRTVATPEEADRWLRWDRSPMGRAAARRDAFHADIAAAWNLPRA